MRHLYNAALTAAAVLVLSSSAMAEAGRPRVVIVEARPVDLPKLGPLALRATVVDAVESQDAEVVPFGNLGDSHPDCVTPACLAAISKSTGATHVLLIDASFANSAYELQLHMWDAGSNTVASGERQRCNVCVASDFLATAHDQAILLCTKRLRAQGPVAVPAPPYPRVADGPPALITGSPSPGTPPVTSPESSGSHRWLGWGLIGAGVLAGAGSIVFLVNDKHGAGCADLPGDSDPCVYNRRTTIPAVVTGVAAAAGIVAGAIVLLRDRHGDPSVALKIGPSGIALGGRL
jgi:hypothetical protein